VPRRGLTLIELLLTIAILGILAAAVIPQLTSDLPERLEAAAQVVAMDLEYVRSLAVSNNTKYRVTFEPAQNRYYLEHSGTNSLFNVLPQSPFRQTGDGADKRTTDLSALPMPAPTVRLVAVVKMQSGGQSAANLEFTPLGGTTAAYEHDLWLACGSGTSERFISISVNPVTGLVQIGPLQSALPSVAASIAAGS
jgi:prepilin-type N-terminal cleavage/methylation domain-containing protein